MDKSLKVLAECTDVRTGKRFAVGDTFSPAPGEEQARRLYKAGCLPEAAIAIGQKADEEAEMAAANGKGAADDDDGTLDLTKLTVDQLKALAAEKNIDLGDATKKADIVAAIELAAEPT